MHLTFLTFMMLFCLYAFGQQKQDFKIISTDIDNFYASFHQMDENRHNMEALFSKNYFARGTKGLRDFYRHKIKDKKQFTTTVEQGKAFYASIEGNLRQVDLFRDTIVNNFKKFKQVYPKARFADVYFVVGRLNSNGTISKNGLIIGVELVSKTTENSTNWNKDLQKWVLDYDHIPVTVFHEMIHFNQKGMRREKNLLSYALREGAAEFLAELFTGSTDGEYAAFQGREADIWKDFEEEMYKDVYTSWHRENEPLRPRNALYWAGYLICKSYYKEATDKKKAVDEILNIKSGRNFYERSKIADKIKVDRGVSLRGIPESKK